MNIPSPTASRERRRRARAEASAWVVQLHGPERSVALEAAFRDWLSADPEHRREFERVTQVWEDARCIPLGGITRLTQWSRPRPASRWAIVASGFLACSVLAFGAYQLWFACVYNTAVGEQRIVRLDDGTRVSLNSDTKLEVRFAQRERHVTLAHGEAYFEVTHNAHRPFIVSAGGHNVTAVGTSFLIRYDQGNTAVTLVEGKVTVSNAMVEQHTPLGQERSATDPGRRNFPATRAGDTHTGGNLVSQFAPAGRGAVATIPPGKGAHEGPRLAELITLTPGERLVLPMDAAARLDEPPIDTVTAWRRGEVVLDRTRLDEAVAEMNRYEDRKLVVESPEIANLKISGIYHVGDSAGFAETVAKLYHLELSRADGEIRISNKRTDLSLAQP